MRTRSCITRPHGWVSFAACIAGAAGSLMIAGCRAPIADSAVTETAPPVTGTLYVVHPSQSGVRPDIAVLRSGKLVPQPGPTGVLIARDNPSIRFPSSPLLLPRSSGTRNAGAGTRTVQACEPVAVSSHGIYGACLRDDGRGTVTIFQLNHPAGTQRDSHTFLMMNVPHMIGFLGDRELAVAADDDSCPAYARNDAVYSFEPRARLWVLGTDGRVIRKGPCIHGLVTGRNKIVYIFHDAKERPLFSLDAKVWQPGLAVTFDGNDRVLYINKWDQLLDEDGKLVADDVVDAFWTR